MSELSEFMLLNSGLARKLNWMACKLQGQTSVKEWRPMNGGDWSICPTRKG